MSTRIRNMVARATILLVNAGARVQSLQARLLGNEVGDSLEYFEHYGFTSNPHAGLEAAVLFMGGSRDHGIIVGVADRKFRIKGLKSGEVAIYTDEGDKILLQRDRKMTVETLHLTINAHEDASVNTKNYTVNASTGVTYNTPSFVLGGQGGCAAALQANVSIKGDTQQQGTITSTGDQVAGGKSTMHHTHTGDSGGITGEPS
ncbi:MAG: phage baseplate assembly protein V [Desulfovibrionaceae bacterium]